MDIIEQTLSEVIINGKKYEMDILNHTHFQDGSQIILLKSPPRKDVVDFIDSTIVRKNGEDL